MSKDLKNSQEESKLENRGHSNDGYYFITICCQDRKSHFGNVRVKEAAERCWLKIPGHFNNLGLDEHIIMPNHLHGIIKIGEPKFLSLAKGKPPLPEKPKEAEKQERNPLLAEIIEWFKAESTEKINKLSGSSGQSFWQEDFYEHVISNRNSLENVRNYIVGNPQNWTKDKENPRNWKNGFKETDIKKYYEKIFLPSTKRKPLALSEV